MITRFRAWLKNDKEMIDVDEIHFDNGQLDFIGDAITFMREADEIELMQSTGLFDKNGQEVFVGDIIKCTRGCPHEVYLEKEYGGTYVGGMPAIYLKGIREGYAWTGDEEIIGNVYQNPDLLEVIK
ncbi:YopX family protein [Streptococcus gordonii]|uniref:YopX family protein n=1 Tax=Streptococcus gordonii TaxID=1302 RepID=UPI000F65F833|nr:YopX family protein [Streptococcus gordonii]RSJ46645.1 YopX protein [Streptococcus gordonii]RSJ49690.1 YopX protein [Streptococcus gordonii]